MPYKKKRSPAKRKPAVRRRRMARKRTVPLVHHFKECLQLASLGTSANSTASGIITFKPNDLLNWPSWSTIFDLYKLTSVKIKCIPRYNQGDVSTPGLTSQAGQLPFLYIAPNRSPMIPPPSSVADILNDDGVRILRPTDPFTMYIKNPKPALKTEGEDVFNIQFDSSKTSLQPWLSTGGGGSTDDQSDNQHYGFRWYVDNTACPLITVIDVYATYYFSMKEQN